MSEKLKIKYKKNVGIIIKGRMSEKHIADATRQLKAVEFQLRAEPKRKNKTVKLLRKFFRCVKFALAPTPRAQHITCELPLSIVARKPFESISVE